MRIRGLKAAGYPLEKNDLTVEEWDDLGRLEDIIRENEAKRPRPVYLVKVKE